MNEQSTSYQKADRNDETVTYSAEQLPSTVLKRLIEEVRVEKTGATTAYDRMHNRHNRGR